MISRMVELADDPRSEDARLHLPSLARMNDYMLGGSANFAIDREAVDGLSEVVPDGPFFIQATRSFLTRAVQHLVREEGVDQFLDLGSGIPTVGNVHETAQRHAPHARVAYVDVEPLAVHHARRLLGGSAERVSVTCADLCDPDAVLGAPGVRELIDFTRPVAVLAVEALSFVAEDERVREVLAAYHRATVPGSFLAISHASRIGWSEEQLAAMVAASERAATPGRARTPAEIRALLPGCSLVEPGLVPAPRWRPEREPSEAEVRSSNCYVALGRREAAG
ncbi:SAM-dependent methyltransferase [Salinifilum ghardaiensis]